VTDARARPTSRTRSLTVAEIIDLATRSLGADFADVSVRGEAAGVRQSGAGHVYFTLEDDQAQLRCVLFASRRARARFQIEDGLELLVRGTLTIYERRGDLQLIARLVEPVGAGERALALEQLKRRLAAEGLFSAERKRPLPRRPETVGVVTSPTGAALHDILGVLGRRHRRFRVIVAPARVQGDGAAAELVQALDRLGQLGTVDVIIVTRGGGSVEDLAPFDREELARAIAAAPVPVISAVGHEIDQTVADLVADVRAATPSAAAELVARSRDELLDQVMALAARLEAAERRALAGLRTRLVAAATTPALRQTGHRPAAYRSRVTDLRHRLAQATRARLLRARTTVEVGARRLAARDVRTQLMGHRQRLGDLRARLSERCRAAVASRRADLATLAARLDGLSPLAVLERGYAIASDADGRALRAADDVVIGESITIRLHRGQLRCEVRDASAPNLADGEE